MMYGRIQAAVLVLVLFFSGGSLYSQTLHRDEPGPAVDRITFGAFDVDRASRDLEAGNMDLYMFGLKIDAAEQLAEDPDFSLYQAPSSTVSILLNPAPASRGEINPFSIRQVRSGVQFLVDREFVAREIYRGTAVPMLSHVSPQDHDYLTVYDIEVAAGITYDPDYGRQLIAEGMISAGAEMQNGIWTYNGQQVRIKLIGRVEDERRNIADLLRLELERAGFRVAVSYLPFAAAINAVYSTDPAAFQWHIYTEGWGRSSLSRYDFSTANSMNAPWLGNMPGWQEIGYWQYKNETLDTLGKSLFRGEFESREERNDIYRRITSLGLEESVRIWVVTAVNSFPARADVRGISDDPVAGLRSPRSLREAYIPGSDNLTVGHLWVWTERTTWNPVGGIGDVYSADIWKYLTDAPLLNHPFTGIPEPERASFTVTTAGARGAMEVPADAVLWDAREDRWRSVGSGVRAKSKVVFNYADYFSSRWHHGEPITMADVVYSIAQGYELAYDPDKSRIEVAIGITSRPFLETFRGYRVVDENSIEVYVDYWHFEENLIAGYASPASLSTPWEMLAAMDDLVFSQRRAAYSDTAASRYNVPWISLVMERDARLVERTIRQLERDSAVPEGVFEIGNFSLVSRAEAAARYRAAMDWFDVYGHLVISNGPFYLSQYDPPAQFAEILAFRDETYPYKTGHWYIGGMERIEIEPVGTVEISPGRDAVIEVSAGGPGELGIRYVFIDPVAREVIYSGDADRVAPGRFAVSIPGSVTGSLFPGLYQLSLVAYSDTIATVTDRLIDVDVLD